MHAGTLEFIAGHIARYEFGFASHFDIAEILNSEYLQIKCLDKQIARLRRLIDSKPSNQGSRARSELITLQRNRAAWTAGEYCTEGPSDSECRDIGGSPISAFSTSDTFERSTHSSGSVAAERAASCPEFRFSKLSVDSVMEQRASSCGIPAQHQCFVSFDPPHACHAGYESLHACQPPTRANDDPGEARGDAQAAPPPSHKEARKEAWAAAAAADPFHADWPYWSRATSASTPAAAAEV